jgi:hypothetical protein
MNWLHRLLETHPLMEMYLEMIQIYFLRRWRRKKRLPLVN